MKKILILFLSILLIACSPTTNIELIDKNEKFKLNNQSHLQSHNFKIDAKDFSNLGIDTTVIGIDDNYCYIDYQKNSIHNYYKVNLKDQSKKLFYQLKDLSGDEGFVFTKQIMSDHSLIIAYDDRTCGKIVEIDTHTGKENVLFSSQQSSWIDIVINNKDSIIIHNIDNVKRKNQEIGQIIEIRKSDKQSKTLCQYEAFYNEEKNTYNGEVIGAVGSLDDNSFVLAHTLLKDESLSVDNTGKTSIGFYDLKEDKFEDLFEYTYSVDQLYGNKDVMFVADYRVTNDDIVTKKVILNENKKYHVYSLDEPNVYSHYRVSLHDNQLIYGKNDEGKLKIYDLKNHNYNTYALFKVKDDNYDTIHVFNKKIYHVSYDQKTINIKQYDK